MNIQDILASMSADRNQRVKLVELGPKDFVLVKALDLLREMERKIEPMLIIRQALVDTLQDMVFEKGAKEGRHEIKLDTEHSVIFTLKDGEFEIEASCECEHHKDAEPEQAAG